ncbi:MAG: ABC transporter ATP-binding protein [bacterium]|nr:ABC transporter ATP-binding protein [bacterium]
MTSLALSIKNLKKTYSNGTEALKDVSLDIPAGDFFALLGPNGAGKTTIIGIVTGLVNKTGGSISVFGYDIEKDSEAARTYIGVVPQEINFNPFEKCIDVVVNQGGYYGIPRKTAIPYADQLLKDLGIGDKRNETGWSLSGGMKRRLLIARALIHKPRFLILDEPTAGVDVELRREMWDYLHILTKRGVTILLTTHYLEEAEQLCKHVAIINKGIIVASGTMDEVLSLHDEDKAQKQGYRGGKLEEVFLQLTAKNSD